MALLAVVIAQLAGVGTGLVDDNDRVQSTAASLQLADQYIAPQNYSKHFVLKTAAHKLKQFQPNVLPLPSDART